MPSESGDMKILGNFRRLIDQVSADASYNPANPALTIAALEARYAAALAAVESVSAKLAPNKIASGERVTAFEQMTKLVTRSRNMLKASGASKEVLDDAETSVRKLLGRRKSSAAKPVTPPPDSPETSENEAGASHSASQLSYENRLGNLGAYIEILSNVPSYAPNEADLKLVSLRAMADDLRSKTDAVSATFVPLSQSRGTRDQLLYNSADCVVNTALLTKAYVGGAMGTDSQLYKQIKGLAFDRKYS